MTTTGNHNPASKPSTQLVHGGPARMRLHLTVPIALLAVGVLLPVLLASAAAIVALALWESPKELVLALVSLTFALTALATAIVVTILLGRRSALARMQSDLLGNVSHDLKTPLAGIRLHAQTLLQEEAALQPDIVRQCAETIVRESEWLAATVDTLLEWRAARRDRAALTFQTASVEAAARKAADRFPAMIPAEGTRFRSSITTSLPVLHDVRAVESIIINLLINAYKYSQEPRDILLSVQDSGGSISIAVTDQGIGIAPQELKRIFRPFYRVDHRLRGQASGAGLGLAIVQHLVRMHGGEVAVQSNPGTGSTFTVVLPATSLPGEESE